MKIMLMIIMPMLIKILTSDPNVRYWNTNFIKHIVLSVVVKVYLEHIIQELGWELGQDDLETDCYSPRVDN